MRLQYFWLVAVLVFAQPFFFLLSFSVLTETTGALLLILALWAWVAEHYTLSVISLALSPLARYELAILWPVWLVMLRRKGLVRLSLLLPLPYFLLNLYWATHGQGWIRFFLPIQPSFFNIPNPFGRGPLWYYPLRFNYIMGGTVLILFVLGFLGTLSSFNLFQATFLAVTGFYMFAFAYVPVFKIFGFRDLCG
jgi:hypothetical protein